jgi:hypothetical protein
VLAVAWTLAELAEAVDPPVELAAVETGPNLQLHP